MRQRLGAPSSLARARFAFLALVFGATYLVLVIAAIELTFLAVPTSAAALAVVAIGLAQSVLLAWLVKRSASTRSALDRANELLAHEREELGRERDLRGRVEGSLGASESRWRESATRLVETEGRLAEAAGRLQRTNGWLRALARSVPAAVVTYDADGVVVAADGAAVDAIRTDGEVVGRSLEELAARRPDAAANVRRALGGDEFTILEPLGDHRVETRYVPLREGPAVIGVLAVSTDLRERDRAEQLLRESDERSRRVLEAAPFGIAFVSPDGRIVLANHAFGEALGLRATEATALRFDEVALDDEAEGPLQERLLGGEIPSYRLEKRFRRKDGEIVLMELVVALVRDPKGRPLYTVRMLKDVGGTQRDAQLARHYSRHDGVTELPNQILLEEKLEEWVAKMKGEQQRLALVLFDVDNIGDLGERLGPHGKDALLRELARRWREPLWDGDTLARVGDHRFGLILPRRGAAGTAELVEKLVAATGDGVSIDGRDLRVDPRLGFAMFPEDAATPDELLRRAGAALSSAKRGGRRCVRYAEGAVR